MTARLIGTFLVILGGAVFLFALTFLHFFSAAPATLWDLTTREPLILTIAALAAFVLAVQSLTTDALWLRVVAACLSFYIFGLIFPIGALTFRFAGIGFWMSSGAAAVMSVGGVLAAVARPSQS